MHYPLIQIGTVLGDRSSALGKEGLPDYVNSLAVDANDVLYAGGNFTIDDANAPVSMVAKLENGEWQQVSTDNLADQIYYLAFDKAGSLYNGKYGSNDVMKLSGNNAWSAIAGKLDNLVTMMLFDPEVTIYVSGYLRDEDIKYLGKFDGTNWSSVGSALNGGVDWLSFGNELSIGGVQQ